MTGNGSWKSHEGKPPDRTLYSAIARVILEKGKAARFTQFRRENVHLRLRLTP
jgi:hypothetical protein